MNQLKKYYCLIGFVIATTVCQGQQVNFVTQGNLRTVFEMAKAQNKKVFLEVFASDCHTCMLFEPIFKDPKVAKYYNDHFISYRLEANAMETKAFLQKQKVNVVSTPTFLFYGTDVKLIYMAALTDKQNTAAIVMQHAAQSLGLQP
jgi:thiol:disulfide interchange protein